MMQGWVIRVIGVLRTKSHLLLQIMQLVTEVDDHCDGVPDGSRPCNIPILHTFITAQ